MTGIMAPSYIKLASSGGEREWETLAVGPHMFVTVQLRSLTDAGPVASWASASRCWREAFSCGTFQKGWLSGILPFRGGV